MREIVVDHPASEVSALLAIRNSGLLEAQGWDLGFWACSDEAPVEKALGALGRRRDRDGAAQDGGWEFQPLKKAHPSTHRRTEDCEAMARQGDWVYIFGSHFGTKQGSLQSRRHFLARFNEAKIEGKLKKARIDLEIARGTFRLHRLLNDGFRSAGLELIERGRHEEKSVHKTLKRGERDHKKWADRLREDDWPLNIEGVEFRDSGSLLVGLRYPVTRDGHPIIAEIADIEKLFDDPPGEPKLLRFWVLGNVGHAEQPRGIRALDRVGQELHAITGSLDSTPEESILIQDHPEGEKAPSQHHRFTLPMVQLESVGLVEAELIGDVGGETRVEGLAVDNDGDVCYVLDDEKIRLRIADDFA